MFNIWQTGNICCIFHVTSVVTPETWKVKRCYTNNTSTGYVNQINAYTKREPGYFSGKVETVDRPKAACLSLSLKI